MVVDAVAAATATIVTSVVAMVAGEVVVAEEVVVVAVEEAAEEVVKAKILKVLEEEEAPNIQIYRQVTSNGAICISNLLKGLTFVRIPPLVHGKTSQLQGLKNEGLTSSTK